MDYGPGSLEDWVAVKKDVFNDSDSETGIRFLVAWNESEERIAVICQEKSGKTQNIWKSTKSKMLSLYELQLVHKQLFLVRSEDILNDCIKRIFHDKQRNFDSSYVCQETEKYLSVALDICGSKVLLGILFDEEQDFLDYEENVNELRRKGYEQTMEREFCELNKVLELRMRAETLLEMVAIYSAEGEAIKRILEALGQLYNFQLWQFLEEREYAQAMIQHVQDDVSTRMIGEKLRQTYENDLLKWKDQFEASNEAVQQLYQEYYRKTWRVLSEQKERMLADQDKFGKAAYEIHALDQLLRLEVLASQERLKFLHVNKATCESNRDRIREKTQKGQVARTSAEMFHEANLSLLNIKLEISDEEETLLLKKKEIVLKIKEDLLQQETFYDAPASVYESEILEDKLQENPELQKLQDKLGKVYRKRATLRNKKKALIKERETKFAKLDEQKRKYNEHHAVQLKRQERQKKQGNVKDIVDEERRKTLQRLKDYRKKYVMLSNDEDGDTKGEISRSSPTPAPSKCLNHKSITSRPMPPKSLPRESTIISPDPDLSSVLPPAPSVPPTSEVATSKPAPNAMPPVNIPPPPPPPPPLPSFSSPAGSLSFPIAAVKIPKKLPEEKKEDNATLGQVNLADILAMRTKLKKVDTTELTNKKKALPDGSLSSILQAVTERIRASHFDSESSEESETNDFED